MKAETKKIVLDAAKRLHKKYGKPSALVSNEVLTALLYQEVLSPSNIAAALAHADDPHVWLMSLASEVDTFYQ